MVECADYVLRPFASSDLCAVQELHASSFRRLAANHYCQNEIEAYDAMCRSQAYLSVLKDSNIFLAVKGSAIVGTVGWQLENKSTARIRKVFVSPRVAGKGIGSQLVKDIENKISESGVKNVVLRASINSISFYERLGFKKVQREDMKILESVSVPVMLMHKTFPS